VQPSDRVGKRERLCGRQIDQFVDIGARREGFPAAAGQDNDADITRARLINGSGELPAQFVVERVEMCGPVDGDLRHALGHIEHDPASVAGSSHQARAYLPLAQFVSSVSSGCPNFEPA
jgi:hypothetical protein